MVKSTMQRVSRMLIRTTLAVLVVVTVVSAAFSVWLATWIPTKGKAWLEARLEERLPLDVTIGSLRYSLWRGLVLKEGSAFDETTRTLWLYAPTGSLQLGPWKSLWLRSIAFRLEADLRAPVPTHVVLGGSFHPRSQALQAAIQMSKISVKEMIPELAQRLPDQWTSGDPPWEVRDLKGLFALNNQRAVIERLQGTTFSFPWQLGGTIDALETPRPTADLFLQTRGEVSSVPARLLGAVASWQPAGTVELQLVCRGPVRDWSLVEVMAQAVIRNGAVTVPRWPNRLKQIEARLQYDHLARQLTIASLSAATQGAALSMHGTATLTSPPTVNLTASGQADLALVRSALPEGHAIQQAAGTVQASARIQGRLPDVQWQAEAKLTQASVTMQPLTDPLQHLQGTIRGSNAALTTDDLTFTYKQVPVQVRATMTEWPAAPHIDGELKAQDLTVTLLAVRRPDRLDVEAGSRLVLRGSMVDVRGEISPFETGAVDMILSGTIDPADVDHLPWVNLDQLHDWAIQGDVGFRLRAVGPRNDVTGLTLGGSLRAQGLRIRGVAVQELHLTIQQADRRLVVESSRTVVAGGLVVGEYSLNHAQQPSSFFLKADVTSIDLAQVAASVPAWQNRGGSGAASAHLTLSGEEGHGASVRGEGWINATGERLANLPLLDKVLGGLFGMLGEHLGLSSLRRAEITSIAGQWRLSQQRFVTEDLRLGAMAGTEPIALYVRGSVGLDKTLDLTVEPELSEQLVLESSTTSTLSSTVLQAMGGLERLRRMIGRHHIGGTIDKPDYKFEVSLDQLLNQLLPQLF